MRLRSSLLLSTLAAVAVPLLAVGTAVAQDAGTSQFTADDFFIGVQFPEGHNLSDFDVARFFNKANCDCSTDVWIYIALSTTGIGKKGTVDKTGTFEFWIGSDCANTFGREQRCVRLAAPTVAEFLNDGRASLKTDARTLSTYTVSGTIDAGLLSVFTPNPTCTLPVESFPQNIYVLQNTSGSPAILKSSQVTIDLTPPPAPDSNQITVEGGNEAVVIRWPGVDSSVTTDLLGYQILCNRGGDLQVFNTGTFTPGFLSCDSTSADAGVLGFQKDFICSDLLAPTTRAFRVKILQNDITYGVAVVAIDRSGNASFPDIFYAKPVKTKSFYDVYKNGDPDHPGAAGGGLCTVSAGATAPGALAGLCGALVVVSVVLARRRRRK
jgi:hypothetical protein